MEDRKEKKVYIQQVKARGCEVCGEKEICCLELHHIDPKTKRINIGRFNSYSLADLRQEVRKCIVLCANCHRKLHGGKLIIKGD